MAELLADPSRQLQRVVAECHTLRLTEGDRVVAEIRPVSQPKTPETLAALFASLPHLTPEEGEAFARDIEEGRKWLNSLPKPNPDPWNDSSTPAR